ncbi:hypothetical protein PtB15_14B25 [Puccinia triticina]|nr:hypothetical protein PtB15_14B25 [Puccinia triticina]
MVEPTRAAKSNTKNANKIQSIGKDKPDDQLVIGEGRSEEEMHDVRGDLAPGTEPVNKSAAELEFEEDDIVESNLKGNSPTREDTHFVDLIRAVPSQLLVLNFDNV